MKHLALVCFALFAAACASTPGSAPPKAASGYSEEMISAGRWRITYAPAKTATTKELKDRTMMRAAQFTLEKGNEWFEIAGQIGGTNKSSLIIVMGKGETLAGGGAKTYDAKETLASLKAAKTS